MKVANKDNVKLAGVYSGISYQHGLFFREGYNKKMAIIPVCTFSSTNLLEYDVLVFPRGTDEEVIYQAKDKVKDFLNRGRVLISFGEVSKNWIPGCRWGGVIPEDDGPLQICKTDSDKAQKSLKHDDLLLIFKGLSSDDLHWHKGATGWCCHGHLLPPKNAEIMVVNTLGNSMMYIDRESTKGTILVTSQLDAICHAFHGVTSAKVLLDNCLEWAKEETLKMKGVV